MEPMTLGSPVSSPVSSSSMFSSSHFPMSTLGVITTSASTSNPYYPSYLLGESPTPLSIRIPPGSVSPGRRVRQFSASNTAALASPSSPQITNRENYFPSSRIGGERQGGPPITSLMGGLPQSPAAKHHSMSIIDHQKIISSPSMSLSLLQSPLCSTPVNAAQSAFQPVTPYTPTRDMLIGMCSETIVESQGSEPLEDTWVTVYGFPVASASYILTQFAQLGTIVDQRQPGLGNWMHLKYQTKLQARKALTKNSKIFNGNIMIGVVPCTDQSIIGNKENLSLDQSSIYSPRDCKTLPSTPKTPKAHMRPLAQAYQAARSDIEVTPTSNTPKKNDSFVSKAIQHILGV